MASQTSGKLRLELMRTGEKAGSWGDITNENLQILEQSASGVKSVAVGSADVTLALTNHVEADGKNFYFKLTGALTANRNVSMENDDTEQRVFIVEDTTDRTSSNYTLTVKTSSGNGIAIPAGSTQLVYSDGNHVSLGIRDKGYYTVPNAAYTAVKDDQLLINTAAAGINGPCTITMPSSPSVGDEVHFLDSGNNFAANNLTVTSSDNILGSSSDLTVSTNGSGFTLVYVNATRGWIYKVA